ncbi:permease [Pseudidiomarina aquimaris]|uniref:Permease n=1 Tax=Pseudidiomarina aquimaris TaxID=641841 RepID=A0A432XHK7_9GAMM|nr:permease [Pseudidiomarina aquimaris]RUO48223.1 permease [Pseudidiomarina aquimaris]|tara:strand:+ start:450 stop:1682 length:1233 start_codon:yes stop_codon:yes gene_type:complete
MNDFLAQWQSAAMTSLGFFWMALWAFILGYFISSVIQVLVTRRQMRAVMGDDGAKSIALGTFFGFISSSCSFAALATTRALFNKGAAFSAAMAFMLASTNLVIELGFVIAVFLSWQFVVGEYLGGFLLILFAWLFVKLTRPKKLIKEARDEEQDDGEENGYDVRHWGDLTDPELWQMVANRYVMEWQMVWKDILIGFTVAGLISAFVPSEFFTWLFQGAGANASELSFGQVLQQTVIGPIAAFFTFIGSMGNIPLAAVLFGEGVAFAGVMAFIFSDLVVLPVLRINAQYYGWKMALYISAMLFTCLVVASLLMHYGLAAFDLLPDASQIENITERDHFKINYGFYLNLLGLLVTGALLYQRWRAQQHDHAGHDHSHDHNHGGASLGTRIMQILSALAAAWLVIGGLLSIG